MVNYACTYPEEGVRHGSGLGLNGECPLAGIYGFMEAGIVVGRW